MNVLLVLAGFSGDSRVFFLKIYVVAWRLISADLLQIKSPGNTTGSIYSLQKEETLRRVALCSPSLIRRLISLFNSRGNQGRRRTAEERETGA